MTFWQLRRNHTLAAVFIACVVVVAIVTLRSFGVLQWLELYTSDLYVTGRADQGPPETRVAVIGVSDAEITDLGWPLSDGILADLLESVIALEPAAIGVDIYRDQPIGDGGDRLASVLRSNDRIIWVTNFGEGAWQGISTPDVLRDTDRQGFSDIVLDPGGIVRRGLLFLDDGQTSQLSFGLRLALQYLSGYGIGATPSESDRNHLRLGPTTLPPFEGNAGGYVSADAKGYQFIVDYLHGVSAVPVLAFRDALQGELAADAIRGKVVIVGVTARSVKDYFYTPFSNGFAIDQTVYGSVLQGTITAQLIRHALDRTPPTRFPSEALENLWILFFTLLGALIGGFLRAPLHFLAACLALAAIVTGTTFVSFLWHWWIPVVPPLIGGLAAAGLTTSYMSHREKEDRKLLMGLFSRHVSGEVAEEIWRTREDFLESGRPKPQQLTATVLFSDIRGFTTVSEEMHEAALMDWLNTYMEAMAAEVMAHHGVVSKFIGDAVMAVFGIPVPRRDEALIAKDAENAVRCALAMVERLKVINSAWQADDLPPITIRVGIHTGPLVAGCLGSTDRLEYTVIGDTVNTTARLESYAEQVLDPASGEMPGGIAISEATRNLLGEEFLTRPVGYAELKGKIQKVAVHQLLGHVAAGGPKPVEVE